MKNTIHHLIFCSLFTSLCAMEIKKVALPTNRLHNSNNANEIVSLTKPRRKTSFESIATPDILLNEFLHETDEDIHIRNSSGSHKILSFHKTHRPSTRELKVEKRKKRKSEPSTQKHKKITRTTDLVIAKSADNLMDITISTTTTTTTPSSASTNPSSTETTPRKVVVSTLYTSSPGDTSPCKTQPLLPTCSSKKSDLDFLIQYADFDWCMAPSIDESQQRALPHVQRWGEGKTAMGQIYANMHSSRLKEPKIIYLMNHYYLSLSQEKDFGLLLKANPNIGKEKPQENYLTKTYRLLQAHINHLCKNTITWPAKLRSEDENGFYHSMLWGNSNFNPIYSDQLTAGLFTGLFLTQIQRDHALKEKMLQLQKKPEYIKPLLTKVTDNLNTLNHIMQGVPFTQ